MLRIAIQLAFRQRCILPTLVVLAVISPTLPLPAAAQVPGGPSAHCHETDGAFTICPDGSAEWSDIPFAHFPETNAYLYSDQSDLDPLLQAVHPVTGEVSSLDTFVLMYDECSRTTPLGPDEYFLVNFDTVEVDNGIEALDRYTEHIFSDGTLIFIENGEPQIDEQGMLRVAEIDGQKGVAGFGVSPNCPFDHVIVEFQIVLDTAGGNSYSPDPSFWGATPPEPPDCEDGEMKIPTRVNVLSGVTVTDEQIGELIGGMNDLLDQAKVCGDFDPKNIQRDVSDEGNNDGNVNRAERDNLRKTCVDELKDTFGSGRGYKLVFVGGFDDAAATAISVHRPDIPCTFVSTAGNHRTLAHEFGHIFTLGPNHLIDDKDTPDPADDVRADGLGHSSDPDNLMNGPRSDTKSKFTDDQISEIQKGAKKRASNTEHASWTDETGEVGSSFIDLYIGSFFAEGLSDDLEVSVNVAGLFPSSPVDARYEILFDTDNNPATGGAFGSFVGIDKVLQISLSGLAPFTSPGGSITSQLLDVVTGSTTPVAPGTVKSIPELIDTESETEPPSAVDIFEGIDQTIPLPSLGLTARQVPVGVRAVDLDTGEVDEAQFEFLLSAGSGLGAIRSGFVSTTLPRNDDGSTSQVPLGFTINFFGASFGSLFVNNNGNVTFDAPLSTFTPFDLTSTGRVIIAPFFADVDTRIGGDPVRFGTGEVDGRAAFGVSWLNVDCFASSPSRAARNFFQLVLIDRSDTGAGDFDIEFNYDQIQWETGQASGGDSACLGGSSARVGYSNGTGAPGTSFELEGSGINGAFLDSNLVTGLVHNSLNSDQLGRYRFSVRSGIPSAEGDRDGDGFADELDNCPATANADQRDGDLNGIGDACQTGGLLHSTAAFLAARLDGTSTAEPVGVTVADEPGLLERLVRIVNFRVAEGLTDSAEELATNLVNSLVASGLVPPEEAQDMIQAVLDAFDLDQDGVPNASDQCPDSDLAPTVVVDACDAGVANVLIADGCTISDLIGNCAIGAANHGAFASCVADLSNRLKGEGVISGEEEGKIERCAARAGLP